MTEKTAAAVVCQTDQSGALITQNAKDQLLSKIDNMQKKGMTGEQVDLMKNVRSCFEQLNLRRFSLSPEQVLELSDDEIRVLFNIVFDWAKKKEKKWLFLRLLPPLILFLSFDNSLVLDFFKTTRRLQRMLGNRFDPAKIVRFS